MYPVYFTPEDASVVLVSHPDSQRNGEELDAVQFNLSAGQSAIHIWNYEQRDNLDKDLLSLDQGQQGGALFDDTALGNQAVKFNIILNVKQFRDAKYIFAPHTRIGDIVITYKAIAGWEPTAEITGYRLIDGYVSTLSTQTSSNANEGNVGASVLIDFKNIQPIKPGSQALFRTEGIEDSPLNEQVDIINTDNTPTSSDTDNTYTPVMIEKWMLDVSLNENPPVRYSPELINQVNTDTLTDGTC